MSEHHAPLFRSLRVDGGTRPATALALAGLVGLVVLGTPGTALASAPTEVSPDVVGEVTVEPTDGLPTEGAVVTVEGTGFDPASGIYVAVCVDNGPGVKPSPCIGGVDTEGAGGATWISDNPPTYAEGLTVPYGPGGSFEVELPVPMVDEVTGVDCREVTCAVTVRYDHLRAEDRGADHVIPVTFAGEDESAVEGDDGGVGGGDGDAGGAQESEPTDEPTATDVPAESGTSDDPAGNDAADGSAEVEASEAGAFPVLPVVLAAVALPILAALLVLRRRRAMGEPGSTGDADQA